MHALPASLICYRAKSQHIHEQTMKIATHSRNVTYTIFLEFEPNRSIDTRSGDVWINWVCHRNASHQTANLQGCTNLNY